MLQNNFKRRLFLRGLGGAAVAVPFLSSVAERAAKAQGTTSSDPKRLIVMFTHYGCITDRWFPQSSHGELTAADYEGTSIEALAPHASKVLMPRGIRAMNEWTEDWTLGQINNPHTQVIGSYFTCVPITPHETNPNEFGALTTFSAMPVAPSLDHVCAKQLSPDGAPLYLRVGGKEDNRQTGISYSASETPFEGIGSLATALSGLTGLFQAGSPLTPDSYQVARGKSLLDLVRDDLSTLERFDMSQSDKQKLANWKELLNETTGAVRAAQCTEETALALGLTDANIQLADDESMGEISTKLANGLDPADLYSNVAVLTSLCDQNRVIFMKYPANHIYQGLGLTQDADELAHRIGSQYIKGTCLEGVNEMLLTIDRFHAEKFAHLVSQLDSFDEGEGTLLDNSATVWFQEFSDGCAFNLNNLPIIHAGGCGDYFKTGQAVNVEDSSSDLHRGNSQAACRDIGEVEDIKSLGTPVEFGNAPINKYYCSLMNAIGVKAGPDGFPLEGGSDEVTHYGMYDQTEDFASGGANEVYISDPGEFSALRVGS